MAFEDDAYKKVRRMLNGWNFSSPHALENMLFDMMQGHQALAMPNPRSADQAENHCMIGYSFASRGH
jgi:hypothetical protein